MIQCPRSSTTKKKSSTPLIFFQGDHTLSRKKKLSVNHHIGELDAYIVEPYNASRQPIHQFWQKMGNGRNVDVRAWPRPSCSARVENITNAWLPCTNMGKFQRAVTLILRCESKFPLIKSLLVSTHSTCPCKNYVPKYSQILNVLDINYQISKKPEH